MAVSEPVCQSENLADICPVVLTMSLIGNKWKILIMRDLLDGPLRYGELKKSVGPISSKVLTENLRQMERDGILTRTVYAEVPPRVEYRLSPLGETMRPIIDSMRAWGNNYKKENEARES